jgi:hypothetical protein
MQEDTMSDAESLRNALGTLQILYNFPQASPKPHAVFNSFKIDHRANAENYQGSRFVFKEARAPRNKPSRRLQALIGESTFTNTACVTTPKAHHRINTFYLSLDKVLRKMKPRFDNDQEILCAL